MPDQLFRLPVIRRSAALLAATFAATLALAACSSSSPSAPPSTSPVTSSQTPSASPPPSSGPTVGAIDHKTGATDVILRMESGGGFVPMEMNASQAPTFTLYGNGVVVFQPTVTTFPEPGADGVVRPAPWRTATLDESQVQELLAFALANGGLGTARDDYPDPTVADAPSTWFTIRADGIDKVVSIMALGDEPQPGPDALARKAFATLATRLRDFDRGGTIATDVYEAERFRGIIIEREAQPGLVTTDWPWADLTPADFKTPVNNEPGLGFPHRTLTAAEIAELKVSDLEGGVQGITLKTADGKLHAFILRPLLVDETE